MSLVQRHRVIACTLTALVAGVWACGGNTRDFDESQGKSGSGGRRDAGVGGSAATASETGAVAGSGGAASGGTDPAADSGASGAGGPATGGMPGAGGSASGGAPAGGGGGNSPSDDPPPSDCVHRYETHADPNTGQSWSSVWYCGNDGGARLYEKPNATSHVGTMDSTTSWFVCYQHGDQHAGGNDVWYYSQGDRSTSGWGSRAAWGYMPAVNVHTRVDPNPGIPRCPFD